MEEYTVDIELNEERIFLTAIAGTRLRDLMLRNDVSPYGKVSGKLNCGGKGICATCGVWVLEKQPPAIHWHDKAAQKFGYPRLSCQIRIHRNMKIVIPDGKIMWGKRTTNPEKR